MNLAPRPEVSPDATTRLAEARRLVVALLATAIAAGLGGAALSLLLHHIQHWAYGYGDERPGFEKSFLYGVMGASLERRVVVLLLCGVIAGLGWRALARWGRPLVSIKRTLGPRAPKAGASNPLMPGFETLCHVLLQIVTVALGSPLGREVAPRELGALAAQRIAGRIGLSREDMRLVIACGAGGGLAAVYNVPIATAVFVLEVLLVELTPKTIAASLAVSTIAALIARVPLGDIHQYQLGSIAVTPSLLIAAALIGPACGFGGFWFARGAPAVAGGAPRGRRRIALSIAAFGAIGLVACALPAVLGNGKGPVQLALDGVLGSDQATALLIAKAAVVYLSLWVGAAGGLLTPSLALGALLASACARVAAPLVADLSAPGLALCGGAAFLAVSQAMPVSAFALTVELSGAAPALWPPIGLAIIGAVAMRRLMSLSQRH